MPFILRRKKTWGKRKLERKGGKAGTDAKSVKAKELGGQRWPSRGISINLSQLQHRMDQNGFWKPVGTVEVEEGEVKRLGDENNLIRTKNEILTEMIWSKKMKIEGMRGEVEKLRGFLSTSSLRFQ